MCGSGGGDDLFGSPSSSDDHPLDDDMLEEIGKQLTEGPSAVRLGSPSRRSHDSPRLDEGPRLDDETASLSLAPSPSRLSAVSSAARSGAPSPVSGDLSWSTLRDHDSAPGGSLHGRPPSNVAKRAALARRLVRLAQQLADGIDVEDSSLLTDQLDFLDKAVARALANGHARVAPSDADSSRRSVHPHSSGLYQSPPSPGHRPSKAHEEAEQAPSGKGGMTGRQAARVVAEATKLNDELLNAMQNLKARQEESEVSGAETPPPCPSVTLKAPGTKPNRHLCLQHVQGLLIERAERAAQRIIFLQSRVVYLYVSLPPSVRLVGSCRASSAPQAPDRVMCSLAIAGKTSCGPTMTSSSTFGCASKPSRCSSHLTRTRTSRVASTCSKASTWRSGESRKVPGSRGNLADHGTNEFETHM